MLVFEGPGGERVSIAPLAFGTALDRIPAIEQFQIAQAEPARLLVRLRTTSVDAKQVWEDARATIAELLSARGLGYVAVELVDEPPFQGTGGKFRQVIPYAEKKR